MDQQRYPVESAVRRPVRQSPSLGRNERCHCGSGKKYKRCCLRLDKQRSTSPTTGGSPDAQPFDLPNIWDPAALHDQLATFSTVLRRDANLNDWVPVAYAVDEFVDEYPELTKPELEDLRLDELACEFAYHYYEPADYTDMAVAFTEAGRDCEPNSPERRSLLLGAFLAACGRADPGDANLLGITLFRMGLRTYRMSLALSRQVLARLRGEDEPGEAGPMADSMWARESAVYDRLAAKLGGESQVVEIAAADLAGYLVRGEFNVPLPLASLLPFRARQPLALRDQQVDASAVQPVVESLGPEDDRLLGEYLDEALKDQELTSLQRAHIELLAVLLQTDRRDGLLNLLAIGSLRQDECAELFYSDDPEVLPTDGEWYARGPLERYADDLERRGYGQLAVRTRGLIDAVVA